jgi:hypothetical protein
MKAHVIEKLQECLVVARFKIIEVTSLLKSDHILKDEYVDPDFYNPSTETLPSPTKINKQSYFK